MRYRHKHDHTIEYEVVIKCTNEDKVYEIEGLGEVSPEIWELNYEPVSGRVAEGREPATDPAGSESSD